uniref:glutathione transferase n=1 Tax=Pygocentrus nattereri TaxID=42514 RepID=A0A3B4EGE8_PYGNA
MSGKVVLYYFDGRGKMESIRWLLAVAGVEFEEVFLTTRAQYEKLVNDGALLFHQVPMVEMDGMKLVQSKAIRNYIAGKYNLYGKELKERCMYLSTAVSVLQWPPQSPDLNPVEHLWDVVEREILITDTLGTSQFLVGNQLSCADVNFFEACLMLEEELPTILSSFPNIQVSSIPTINKFLQPGRQRKPVPDEVHVKIVREVLSHIYI